MIKESKLKTQGTLVASLAESVVELGESVNMSSELLLNKYDNLI